jgi:hypothetical protein
MGAQPCLLEMVVLEHQEGPVEAQVCHWVDQPGYRGHKEGGPIEMGVVLQGRSHSCEPRAMEGRDPGLR